MIKNASVGVKLTGCLKGVIRLMRDKKTNKRFLAMWIDYGPLLAIALLLSLLKPPFLSWFLILKIETGIGVIGLPSVGAVLLFAYLFGKELIFRNASLGKRLMGLMIVDERWQAPSALRLLKRGVMLTVFSVVIIGQCKGDAERLAAWEKAHLNLRVVERSFYEELKQIALQKTGDFAENMEILYRLSCEQSDQK